MRVRREIVLPTTPAETWSVVTEWERQSEWMVDADGVSVRSTGREGVGVRLAVRTRIFGIPAFTEPMEVTRWEPPHRLDLRHGGIVAGVGSWAFSVVEGGTMFVWWEDVRLAVPYVGGAAAACYRPILGALMGRSMEGLRRHVISLGPR